MKKSLLILLIIPLLAGKSVSVNPAYLGKYKYYDQQRMQMTIWIVSLNPKHPDRADFRRTTDTVPLFTVQMQDATHFKTRHDFTEHIAINTDVRRSCGGTFGNGEMNLVLGYETITFGVRKNLVNKVVSEHLFKKVVE
jgi:hypothetical protein